MTPTMPHNISISVSDDDSDDPSSRMRVRLRRKRKKPPPPGLRRHPLRRALARLIRCWPALLLVPALLLLLLETSWLRTGKPPPPPPPPPPVAVEVKPDPAPGKEEGTGNLNRLDHATRIVGGVRERCLKILPPEEIQTLEFPDAAHHNSVLKRVVYITAADKQQTRNNGTAILQNTGPSRFNLFTGYQTLQDREESFKLNETATVHCGFCSESGGFVISDDDKHFMQTCKAVVSTCAFGGGDDLYQPIGMTEASLKKVCYVAFWDEITLSAQEAEGNVMDTDHMIGKWRIVVVKDLPFSDQRLNGKIPKILSHRLFPQARYSIWVDSKSQFRRDPVGVLEALLWRTNSVLAISEHGARSSLYDEAKAIVRKHKATPEEVEVQINQYRRDGIPDDKRINGKKALAEASIIVREHTPYTNLFMCLWFNEVVRFTSRDQLSFPYVLRRLKMPGLNMFPVCTRKDLVNSMGHKRKVKPLEKSAG